MELPGVISVCSADNTIDPILIFDGAIMYERSPSSYFIRAMYAERFGSYSILSTVPVIPVLDLLKSMIL